MADVASEFKNAVLVPTASLSGFVCLEQNIILPVPARCPHRETDGRSGGVICSARRIATWGARKTGSNGVTDIFLRKISN